MAESVQVAVAGTALVEVGAIGLGAVGHPPRGHRRRRLHRHPRRRPIAMLGFFILPSRRDDAKSELREKIEALRNQLMASLTGQFDREIERSRRRIEEAIAPYTRFVRAERERLTEVRGELRGVDEGLVRLRSRVEAL